MALLPMLAGAQVLSRDFNGAAGNKASFNASTKDAHLGNSYITRGNGLIQQHRLHKML